MGDKINIQIERKTYDKINNVKKWYNMDNEDNKNQKEIIDHVFSQFIKSEDIEYLYELKDKDKSSINWNNAMIKHRRLDVNFTDSDRDKVNRIKKFLQNQEITKNKKITTPMVIRTALDKYLELFPQIDNTEDLYIKQKKFLGKNNV